MQGHVLVNGQLIGGTELRILPSDSVMMTVEDGTCRITCQKITKNVVEDLGVAAYVIGAKVQPLANKELYGGFPEVFYATVKANFPPSSYLQKLHYDNVAHYFLQTQCGSVRIREDGLKRSQLPQADSPGKP